MKKMLLCLIAGLFIMNGCSNAQSMSSKKILIVYLSRTGNTKAIAEIIQKNVGGNLAALEQRNYVLQIHAKKNPASIIINNKKFSSSQYHYTNEKNGLLIIDCGKFDVHKKVKILIK